MIDHPSHSPDLVTCDIWLFSYLKEKKKNVFAVFIPKAVKEHFLSIPRNEWLEVFNL